MSAALGATRESGRRFTLLSGLAPSLRTGELVEGTPYRVRAHVASGGMGEVYEVVHHGLERRAALKVLRIEHASRVDLGERLCEEARVLASMSIAATPTVFDLGRLVDGRPFYVMELVDGSDLRTELRRMGVFSVPSAVRMGVELLGALGQVHQHGVVHRDLKLENVVLSRSGSIKLIDFGVARRADLALRKTGRGIALGTPRTMAPEQHVAAEVDCRADIYAAGLLLYELMTGSGPFDHSGRSVAGLRIAHCHRAPLPPSRRAPQQIPPAIERVILRALEKKPQARFPSAEEMANALDDAMVLGACFDDEPTDIDV